MEPSSRTPEGDDNTCHICGHDVCIEPTCPPGDATCPYCGALIWFANESLDAGTDGQAARQWQRAKAAIDANDLRIAERLLRFAVALDPSSAEFKKTFEDVKSRRREKKHGKRQPRVRSQRT